MGKGSRLLPILAIDENLPGINGWVRDESIMLKIAVAYWFVINMPTMRAVFDDII